MAEGAAHVHSFLGLEAALHWSTLEERWVAAVARPKAQSHGQGFPASFFALYNRDNYNYRDCINASKAGLYPLGFEIKSRNNSRYV